MKGSNYEEQPPTVEATVRLWKTKQSERRATVASTSPLSDFPKYASEIEQQAFRKIKKWKYDFALKLDNVLGERLQEIIAKREEELNRSKKPRVLKVPMNLSDKEMGQLRNNLLLELKSKSFGDNNIAEVTGDRFQCSSPPSPPPIPRIKRPRKASFDQDPADLRVQMINELNRLVSCIPKKENIFNCYKPSSLLPNSSKASLHVKPKRIAYEPSSIDLKALDFDNIHDLLCWHEAERKRLKAELDMLPRAEQSGEHQVGHLCTANDPRP